MPSPSPRASRPAAGDLAATPGARAWLTAALTVGTLWSVVGCQTEGPLSPYRQHCLECALRRNSASTSLPVAARQLDEACAGGDQRSCSVLGVMYETGHGVARDPHRAADLFAHACSEGIQSACVNHGLLKERGDAGRRDPAGAMLLFEWACLGDLGDGCRHLGRARYQAGDPGGAQRALERGCAVGDAQCCQGLGVMYQHGHGVTLDLERARALLQRACELGEMGACARLDGLRRPSATGRNQDEPTQGL